MAYVAHVRMPTDRAHGYAIMKMCEQFAATGADVELVVPARTHGIQEDPYLYYRIERNFRLTRLWATDMLGAAEGSSIPYLLDLTTFLFSVYRRKFSDDTIVYTRDYQVALAARARHIILEIHSVPENSQLFERALRRAEKFVVITRGLEDALVARGIERERIAIAPDAVDLDEFSVEPDRARIWEEFGVDSAKKIALYTGHFYGWKGGETFAEAAQYLPESVEVVLMGGVDNELRDFKERYESANTHIIGFQDRNKLAAILKSADVLVLPNSGKAKISAHYTSPLKLFQYMASGAPIVASDLPSIREILTEETSYWFKPDDPQDLARSIERALADTAEARRKAEKARMEVQKYTWDARARSILKHIA